MSDVERLLQSAKRGIETQLKIMRRPEAYGVSNEGVAYHVLVAIVLALDAAAREVAEQTGAMKTDENPCP